ncbi:hypothetical protein D3C86_2195490 [compost metagenome]
MDVPVPLGARVPRRAEQRGDGADRWCGDDGRAIRGNLRLHLVPFQNAARIVEAWYRL